MLPATLGSPLVHVAGNFSPLVHVLSSPLVHVAGNFMFWGVRLSMLPATFLKSMS